MPGTAAEPTVAQTLVIGGDGYLGTQLVRTGQGGVVGTSRRPGAAHPLDLTSPDLRPLRLQERGIGSAILVAACPHVRWCEEHPAEARRLNVDGTWSIIEQLRQDGVLPVFISSDYVFDGRRGDYTESDAPGPTTEYGRNKREIEARLLDEGPGLIVRLSKLVGVKRHPANLLSQMIDDLAAGRVLRSAADQVNSPTFVEDAARGILALIARHQQGIVHLAAAPCSRLDLARRVAAAWGAAPSTVEAIALDDLNEGFTRPKNTSLRSEFVPPVSFAPLDTLIIRAVRASRSHGDAGQESG